jgi:hypothetical protein
VSHKTVKWVFGHQCRRLVEAQPLEGLRGHYSLCSGVVVTFPCPLPHLPLCCPTGIGGFGLLTARMDNNHKNMLPAWRSALRAAVGVSAHMEQSGPSAGSALRANCSSTPPLLTFLCFHQTVNLRSNTRLARCEGPYSLNTSHIAHTL